MDRGLSSSGAARWHVGLTTPWTRLLVLLILLGCDTDPPPSENVPAPARGPAISAYEGTIVAVGDSLTAGLGVAEAQAYPAQLAHLLKIDGYSYNVINAGVSGETSSGARSRIQWVISSLKPDIVILETGANDGLRGIDPHVLETNLNRICAILTTHNIQIVLAGMRILPNLGPEYIKAFATVYPRIAQKYPVIFMPFFLKDVAGDTQLNQPDRIHPTAQGYRRIADNIYPYILKAIENHRSTAAARGEAAK